ncbi:MAG: GNAT family N-acetyltransferase [Holosporaceae bacterium]|nr:MAG: GNAT family N-acetyltransferase [Holosporaceae bacterium]
MRGGCVLKQAKLLGMVSLRLVPKEGLINFWVGGWISLSRLCGYSPFNGAVEMVWNIVPSEWGKGHGASAARAFMNSVVTDVYDFSYVYASALATNERSIRLAKSLGMDLWNIPAEMGKRPDYLDRRGNLFLESVEMRFLGS